MWRAGNERVAWFNGDFMPEREVRIPFRDRSWVYGDGCFDMTRTFGHKLFKVKEHVDRLYRSLKYLRIDPGFGPERMCALTEELFERNRRLLGPDDDYWVGQRISRGVKDVPGDNLDYHGPNVVLECAPLPFAQRAKLFREGIRVMVPSQRRVPPDSLTPRAKTHNYLNLIVADQEVQSIDPEAWAVLLDINGNLCEGLGSVLNLTLDDEVVDVVAGGFDVAIRIGEVIEKDMVVAPLGKELRQVAVASPDYLALHSSPEHPRDLVRHRCIQWRWPGRVTPYAWEFFENGAWFEVVVAGPVIVNDKEMANRLALQGVGIAFSVEETVAAPIATGRLIPLLERWSAPFPGYFLCYPQQRQMAPALRAFIDAVRGGELPRRPTTLGRVLEAPAVAPSSSFSAGRAAGGSAI